MSRRVCKQGDCNCPIEFKSDQGIIVFKFKTDILLRSLNHEGNIEILIRSNDARLNCKMRLTHGMRIRFSGLIVLDNNLTREEYFYGRVSDISKVSKTFLITLDSGDLNTKPINLKENTFAFIA